MKREEFIEGLRATADWFEAHEAVPVPMNRYEIFIGAFEEPETKELALRIARAMGTCQKSHSTEYLTLVKEIGAILVKFCFYREAVCTKRVVGTTDVPEYVVPAHTKEIVEWDCHPLLANGETTP